MKTTLPTLEPKRKRKTRRSETRLGSRGVILETSIPRSALSIKPAIHFWQINQSRIVGLCVLALFLWILYLVFTLHDFYIYGAVVQGNRILTAQEIYAASQVDSLSIFWVNPATIKANIEKLPNIKAAEISITLPANLHITVQEREPAVIWQSGETIWWIDREGTFVPPRAEANIADKRLRIIDGDARAIKANDAIDPAIIYGAQIVHTQKPEITDLFYTQQFGLTYKTPEGWPIYLGQSINIRAKLRVADALRTDLVARQVSPAFIDVRNPLRAVYQE